MDDQEQKREQAQNQTEPAPLTKEQLRGLLNDFLDQLIASKLPTPASTPRAEPNEQFRDGEDDRILRRYTVSTYLEPALDFPRVSLAVKPRKRSARCVSACTTTARVSSNRLDFAPVRSSMYKARFTSIIRAAT